MPKARSRTSSTKEGRPSVEPRAQARRPVRIKKLHAEFLARARVVRGATADRRGVPHVVPVCTVLDRDRLYFGTGDDARKLRNVRENPRIRLVADHYSEAWNGLRGVMLVGTAALHARGARFRRARKLIYSKYPQYAHDAALVEGDSVMIEITPASVFAWGFDS